MTAFCDYRSCLGSCTHHVDLPASLWILSPPAVIPHAFCSSNHPYHFLPGVFSVLTPPALEDTSRSSAATVAVMLGQQLTSTGQGGTTQLSEHNWDAQPIGWDSTEWCPVEYPVAGTTAVMLCTLDI
jgi:hypothetical protein